MIYRHYQEDAINKGVSFFKERKPVASIEILPTAAGKSIIIAGICKGTGEKILVLQPSKELLKQNYEKFINLGGTASIFSASLGIKEIGDITYATIGSIKSLGANFRLLGITKIIIDECDRYPRENSGMLKKFIKDCKATHVLGLTATPFKLQTNTNLNGESYSRLMMLTQRNKTGTFFKKIIHVTQIQELVKLGYWAKLEYEVFDFDTGKLKYNSTGADFTVSSMEAAYENQNIESKIVEYIKVSTRKSILVAVTSVAQAQALALKIPNSAAVWGDMDSKDREKIVEDFKALKIRVVIQVNVLSVGFDHPELDCVIAGRPTASLSWWYQFVGRITRIHPDKKDGLIVDFVGNTDKFGKIEDLYFVEEDGFWKLYGALGVLLTGVPINEIGEHTTQTEGKKQEEYLKYQEEIKKNSENTECILTFGKFKGEEVRNTPKWYRDWLLKNLEWNKRIIHIKIEIEKLNEQEKKA